MAIMMVVKVGGSYLSPHLLPPSDAVYGLAFANSLAFLSGWAIGEFWLHARLGRLGSRRIAVTIGKGVVASAIAAGIGWIAARVTPTGVSGAWLALVTGGIIGIAAAVCVLMVLRTKEIGPIRRRIVSLTRLSRA